MSDYLTTIYSGADPLTKGFVSLLNDQNKILDQYTDVVKKYHSTSEVDKLLREYKINDINDEKQKYFLKHLNIFFKIENKYSIKDKRMNILSSLLAYSNDPINNLFNFLNKKIKQTSLNDYLNILQSKSFSILYENQLLILKKNNSIYYKNFIVNKDLFDENNYKLYKSLDVYIKNINLHKKTFNNILIKICDIYNQFSQDETPLEDIKIIFSDEDDNKKTSNIIDKIINEEVKPVSNDEFINSLFNPIDSYITSMFDKYNELASKLTYESKDCRIIKSILYVITYVMKDKNFDAAKYMKSMLNSDIGWAVGDENNKEPSFYGDSEFAKFIYGYYPYMTGKENPYTDLIDNKIIKQMDYNAILINQYFKNNGLKNLGFDDDNVQKIYNLLVNFRKMVKIIDSPISISGTADNFIQGIISGIMNSAATMLDFSISGIAKGLFYTEIIPINSKKYSLAQVYNYINFIKLILQNSGENKEVSYIDREEFINQAYVLLGINENSLMKIGYCAYDTDLNEAASLNMYDDSFYQNDNDMIFTVRNDLKLLYSLIQFGIQKKSVLTGDLNFEKKFIYGNEYAVRDILEYLTDTEIYYVFKLYLINPWTLDDNLGSVNNKEIYDFNKKLLNIENFHDHHSNAFYNLYLNKSPNSIYEEMESYDFRNTKYKNLINSMFNQYRKILKYNKKQLDNIVFESNDITDIDDFLVRFLPSIIELIKLLGITSVNFETIINFLDYLLTFISNILFRTLFVEVKVAINEKLKRYTEKLLKPIEEFKIGDGKEIKMDFNFGESKFVQSIDLIIDMIERGNFNLFSIQSCFENNTSHYDPNYDPMENDDLVFNGGHNSISRNEFFDDTINSLDKSYDGANTDNDINIEFISKDNNKIYYEKDDIKDAIVDTSSKDNNKIYYEKGNIIIEKSDGSKNIIVSQNDKVNIDYIYKEFPSVSDKILSNNEYEQLIEIRDYINNITNQQLTYLSKQLTLTKEKLKVEYSKQLPSYTEIKKLNKNIEELTSAINDVKKENRILESDNDVIIIKDFSNTNNNTLNTTQNYYSNLNEFFNKKEILKEVNEVISEQEISLTNYQITQLLK